MLKPSILTKETPMSANTENGIAEKENQERIEAAVAAVDPCDWCREQEGQLILELATY